MIKKYWIVCLFHLGLYSVRFGLAVYPPFPTRPSIPSIIPIDAPRCGIGNPPPTSPSPKISGGIETGPNEFPWQSYLTSLDGSMTCSGALISDRWILTAASCIIGKVNLTVYLGVHQLENESERTRETFFSTDLFYYPGYDPYFKTNDIGLVKLPISVGISRTISPICLPLSNDPDHEGESVLLTGWWNPVSKHLVKKSTLSTNHPTESHHRINRWSNFFNDFEESGGAAFSETDRNNLKKSSPPSSTVHLMLGVENFENGRNPLRKIDATVISNYNCALYHGSNTVTRSTICANGSNGNEICQEDYGGPMNYQDETSGTWTLIGVASFRSGPNSVPNITCQSNTPFGYTRLKSFLPWIYFVTGLPEPEIPTTFSPSTTDLLSTYETETSSTPLTNTIYTDSAESSPMSSTLDFIEDLTTPTATVTSTQPNGASISLRYSISCYYLVFVALIFQAAIDYFMINT